MIIVIKGADFSANNLGKVTIDYAQKTKDVLEAFGNTDLTTQNKDALDAFIVGLEESGVFSKIKSLYLPVLANDLAKSMINIASETLTADVLPNPVSYSLHSTGGIIADNSNNPLIVTLDTDTLSAANVHVLGVNTQLVEQTGAFFMPISSPDPSDFMLNLSDGGANLLLSSNTRFGGVNIYNVVTSKPALFYDISLKGISMIDGNGMMALRRNEVAPIIYTAPITPVPIGATKNLNLSGHNNTRMTAPMGLMSIGEGLTENELLEYNTLAQSLMIAFDIEFYS